MGWRKTGGRPRELISEIRKLAVAFNPPPSYQTHTHTHTRSITLASPAHTAYCVQRQLLCWDILTFATIRYDTTCYVNVRSKANMSQLNLPHGTDNFKSRFKVVAFTAKRN